MTIIIGLVENETVYMGSDSTASDSWIQVPLATSKISKQGDFMFGSSGSLRRVNILEHQFDVPVRPSAISDDNYIVEHVVEAMRLRFKELGFISTESGSDKAADDGETLIGYRGNIYLVDGQFAVLKNINGLHAAGSGQRVALGAMMAMTRTEPVRRIKRALEITSQLIMGIQGPFSVVCLPKDN